MTLKRSALAYRAAAFVAVAFALLALVVPALSAPSSTSTTSGSTPAGSIPLTASLTASAPTVPTGGTFGYTAEVRLDERASYLQSVLEVFRPSGQLLFRRTRVANDVGPGTLRFGFKRELTDALALAPGSYPVKLTTSADFAGSTVSTETTGALRVFAKDGPRVRVALVVRVVGQPMSSPTGRFAIDPARSTGARDAVDAISRRILSDPDARISLAVPPVLLAEWRRLSDGYELIDGTAVRPDGPVPLAYAATLADLRAALSTGRLELLMLGYADPNLTDLANHGLAADVGPQYDAGISAVFQSLEITPSAGTAPAGGCVPPNELGLLAGMGVRHVVVDSECVRLGKGHPESGAYVVDGEKVRVLVADTVASVRLTQGEQATAVQRSFARLVHAAKQPLVMRLDIDGDSPNSTDTVGAALSELEAQPWIEIANTSSLKPATGAGKVRLQAGHSTPKAPKGFWKTVARSRSYADAYSAAVGAGDPAASIASAQSLLAESSAWSGPGTTWAGAARGLSLADSSLKVTKPVLDGVSVTAQPITLSGSTGEVPITIVNATDKTLDVVVTVTSSGGMRVSGSTSIPTTLRPQETYLEIPVDMQTGLSGKLNVEVSSAGLTLSRKSVTVRASYLDRLALGGAVAIALVGMLVFIVRRNRLSEARSDDSRGPSSYTGDD